MQVKDYPTPTAPMTDVAPSPVYTDGRVEETIATGEAAAAFLAAGIGVFFIGVFTTLAEAFVDFRNFLAFNSGVGPLSGKTIVPVVIWLAAWIGLYFAWRNKNIDFARTFVISLVLVGLGLLGTFPLFFDLFAP